MINFLIKIWYKLANLFAPKPKQEQVLEPAKAIETITTAAAKPTAEQKPEKQVAPSWFLVAQKEVGVKEW